MGSLLGERRRRTQSAPARGRGAGWSTPGCRDHDGGAGEASAAWRRHRRRERYGGRKDSEEGKPADRPGVKGPGQWRRRWGGPLQRHPDRLQTAALTGVQANDPGDGWFALGGVAGTVRTVRCGRRRRDRPATRSLLAGG